VGLGLVEARKGKFVNAPDVKRYLTEEGEDSMVCITRHMSQMYDSWADLEDIVKKGRPKRRASTDLNIIMDRKRNRDFICGMFEIGFDNAKLLADTVDISDVRKMLDIGGGPAQYPIAFSAKNPDTSFVVADYPNTVRVAKGYVKKYGLQKRIKLVECEFFDVEDLSLGDDFDMALLSQVLHAASDDKCKALLKKTRETLRPGGRILINENAMDDSRLSPPPPLIFAINMLVNTEGRTFTTGELKAWLKEAGFRKVKATRLHARSVLVEGTR